MNLNRVGLPILAPLKIPRIPPEPRTLPDRLEEPINLKLIPDFWELKGNSK